MSKIKVSKPKTSVLTYDNLIACLKKDYPFCKLTDERLKTIKELTPEPQQRFEIEIKNANTDIVNGLRRGFFEMKTPAISVALDEIYSDDPYVSRLGDYIQARLKLVPVTVTGDATGDETVSKDIELTLDIKNQENDSIVVTSGDFVCSSKELKWDKHIRIVELNPGKFLKCKMFLEWGTNHLGFKKVGPIFYEPLEYKEPYPKSYSVHPHDYKIGFDTPSLFNPVELYNYNIKSLIKRLEHAKKNVTDFISCGILPYTSSELNVSQLGEAIKYSFAEETYTLGNLIMRYVYLEDSTIKFINTGDDHPEDTTVQVRINHPQHSKIIITALDKCIRDYAALII
jgi:DNA-directed RNA polymerase subunit L